MASYLPEPEVEEGSSTPQNSLRIRLIQTALNSRHLAPTAPDTLHCFPYLDADPFILNFTPHMIFHGKGSLAHFSHCRLIDGSGNQPRFETALIEEEGMKCRLICIPKFAETGQLVLFNTRTLDVKVVCVDASGMETDGIH